MAEVGEDRNDLIGVAEGSNEWANRWALSKIMQ
jgi:hypothetical protein